jgi:hypothetical protein
MLGSKKWNSEAEKFKSRKKILHAGIEHSTIFFAMRF